MRKGRRNFKKFFTGTTSAFVMGGMMTDWAVPMKKA